MERLGRLAPDQRAAATAPPGPVLCVAPAGSGKTTTLVARIAWLVATGADPATVCAVTFNRRAAEELGGRLATALAPLGVEARALRVRTFHALGREILRASGESVEPLADRARILRRLRPGVSAADLRRHDDAISRAKLDRGLEAGALPPDALADPDVRLFVEYETAVRATGGLDFDDLVVRAVRVLERRPEVLARWRRACTHLLVDEVQDVDRTQLRLALLLAAPENRIFLVGDDDQTIYGWRLADVRRVLGLAASLPGLRRVDLVTNYRCPGPVVERAVRLIEGNRERFAKGIRARDGATGALALAPDPSGGIDAIRRFIARPLPEGRTRAVLARTNRELIVPAALALELGVPFSAPGVRLLLEDPRVESLLASADTTTDPRLPLLVRLGVVRDRVRGPEASSDTAAPGFAAADEDDGEVSDVDIATALLAWAPAAPDLASFRAIVAARRSRLAELRVEGAPLTMSTAHGTKGLEFDEVAVIGLDEGTFPSGRTLAESSEPARVLEEERRLGYVAWTRARGLLVLVYDPARPSPFLREAFSEAELDLVPPEAPTSLLSTLAMADARAPPVRRVRVRTGRRCRAGRPRGGPPSARRRATSRRSPRTRTRPSRNPRTRAPGRPTGIRGPGPGPSWPGRPC
jgi:DNA helicase-2/ATP-dependent DNA helicase PcrA